MKENFACRGSLRYTSKCKEDWFGKEDKTVRLQLLSIFCLAFYALVFASAESTNAQGKRDLAEIRKATASKLIQPKYKNEPKYTLVVVGPDAEKKIWMVLDGFKTIYADLNSNGKIEPESEKFEAVDVKEYPKGNHNLAKHSFEFGEVGGHKLSLTLFVPSPDYQSNSALLQKHADRLRENGWVKCWLARTKRIVKNEGMTGLVFTPKAEDAQVSWLGGPLRIVATDRDLRPRQKLGFDRPTDNYTVTVGSIGLPVRNTKGPVITPVMEGDLPKEIHPVAKFLFKSGVVEVELNQLKSRGQLSGQFLLPDGEKAADVDVEIGYPKSSRSNIGSTTQKIQIVYQVRR